MIKRFPNRNPRSKGIKIKHVLQIVLLLGVCFWLIYQVKHHHGKKREFDESGEKLSVRTHQTDQIVKIGRKGLLPGKDGLNQNEKHEEDEEDEHVVEDEVNKHEHGEEEEGNDHEAEESKDNEHEGREQEEEENKHGTEVLEEENQHEHDEEQEEEGDLHETEESKDNKREGKEQEDEENKHGVEELKEDENKSEEMEDEAKGGDDDEIDENDKDKAEVEVDRDDEKDKEEEGDAKENEDIEDGEKEGGLAENDGDHVAREEHYKGDDASSAVAHDTHGTSTETETLSMESSGVNLETNITKPENETAYSDESNQNQNDSNLKVVEGEGVDKISSNSTSGKESGNDNVSNTPISSEQNKTVETTMITGDIKSVQTEGLEQSGNITSEENLPDTNTTVSVQTENGGTTVGESSNPRNGEFEKVIRFAASNETENSSTNLDRNESSGTTDGDESKGNGESNESQNIDATEDEMFKGDASMGGGNDDTSNTISADEIVDSVEHDAFDSFDTHIHDHKDAAEVQTDLDTLPDTRSEGYNGDETAAE